MESTDKLQIDITDPADIRSKLPAAKDRYRLKLEAADQMKRDADHLGGLLVSLAQMVGEEFVLPKGPATPTANGSASADTPQPKKNAPAQDLAIAGLTRFGRPAGPTVLYDYMQEQGLKVPTNANALGAALWNATKNRRIMKTADGLYALLEWGTDQPKLQDEAPQSDQLPTSGDGSE
jgi:hypothetical protein